MAEHKIHFCKSGNWLFSEPANGMTLNGLTVASVFREYRAILQGQLPSPEMAEIMNPNTKVVIVFADGRTIQKRMKLSTMNHSALTIPDNNVGESATQEASFQEDQEDASLERTAEEDSETTDDEVLDATCIDDWNSSIFGNKLSKLLPPGPVQPAPMRQSTTSAPHSSVSTNSATHQVCNQFSYVDDSIMSSNSVCYFGGRKKRLAAKYCPKPRPPGYVQPPRMSEQPGPIPDAPDEDN